MNSRTTPRIRPVVSRGVVKQALEWHNIPLPKVTLTGSYKWPNGATSCDYDLVWPLAVIEKLVGAKVSHSGCAAFTRFLYKLHDCFCDDITVVQMYPELKQGKRGKKDVMRAKIYCKIQPR